jgi:hypothetical protein
MISDIALDAAQPRPSAPRSGALLLALLNQAGAGPGSRVRVIGRDGLAPLIWLCRQGFDDVGYICLAAGGPYEAADVLLALGGLTAHELAALPGQLRLLRDGGSLIVKTTPSGAPADALIDGAGLLVVRRVARHGHELRLAVKAPARAQTLSRAA